MQMTASDMLLYLYVQKLKEKVKLPINKPSCDLILINYNSFYFTLGNHRD